MTWLDRYAPLAAAAVVCAWWSYTRHYRPGRALLVGLATLVLVPTISVVAFVLLSTPAANR